MQTPTFAETIKRAMEDWNRATPAQREKALAYASERAAVAEERMLRSALAGVR